MQNWFTNSRAHYRKEWDGKYRQPGIFARVLADAIRFLPKVGPLSVLKFKPPTPEVDNLFQKSFEQTVAEYQNLLHEVDNGTLKLPSRDFDTGQPTRPT